MENQRKKTILEFQRKVEGPQQIYLEGVKGFYQGQLLQKGNKLIANGKGSLIISNFIYQGDFKNGQAQGKGKITMLPDIKAIKQLEKLMSAHSDSPIIEEDVLILKNVIKQHRHRAIGYFKGQFAEGSKEGKGKFYNENQQVIKEGIWSNNQFSKILSYPHLEEKNKQKLEMNKQKKEFKPIRRVFQPIYN